MSATPLLSLELLGSPVIRREGVPVSGRAAHRRRMAILAVLAAARGRPVARDTLLALLWPELDEAGGRHTLSESLYVLRRELGREIFTAVGGEVALNLDAVWCDVDAFERAVETGRRGDAVALYRGPFLDGFYVDGAGEFERWSGAERDRLARAFAKAVEELAAEAEAGGDPATAAGWWCRLAVYEPYSSRVALRLALALERAGDAAAALRQVEAHAAVLRDELDVGPSPELVAVVERLRARADALPPRRPRVPASAVEGQADADAPDPTQAAPAPPTDPPAGVGEGAGPRERRAVVAPPPRRRRVLRDGRRGWGALALVIAGAAALGAFMTREAPARRASGLDPHRIAVLYLDDLSPRGELGYLAGGLTESLIHELAQVDALQVVSRNGVKPYQRASVPLDSIAARLRVGSVVEGSVQPYGDSVRVTVHLVDAEALTELDSRVIVRARGDVVALQSALADEVVGALRRRLGREVRRREVEAETGSARALEAVLRAERFGDDAAAVARFAGPGDHAAALRLLQRADSLLAAAEAEDPRWSRPTVGRGWIALQGAELQDGARRDERTAAALAFAGRVLSREPGHAAALELRGRARWRAALRGLAASQRAGLAAAERDLRDAAAAEPGGASAWAALSQVALAQGSLGEAKLAADRALQNDAYLEEAPYLLRRIYFAALGRADYAAAGEACGRGARMFPGDWTFVECRLTLLRADTSHPPRPDVAWRLVAELDRIDPPTAARAAGRAYAPHYRRMVAAAVTARAGDADSARAVLGRARRDVAGDPDARIAILFDEACLRLALGDRDGARRALEAYAAARPALRGYLAGEPLVRGLLTPAGAPPSAAP